MVQNENAKKSNVTHMFTQWGQYIIHDIVHTPVVVNDDGSDLDCNCDTPNVECINIEIPMHDKQLRCQNLSLFWKNIFSKL
jgi:hypothetical protein